MIKSYTQIRRYDGRYEGNEIKMTSFSEFEGKKVVTEDFVEVSDIAFLYKHIKQVHNNNPSIETTKEVFNYFHNKNYPWFLMETNSTKK